MRIAHYMNGLTYPGGIASYIHRITKAQLAAGNRVYLFDTLPIKTDLVPTDDQIVICDDDLYKQAISLQIDILHLHTSVSKLPPPELAVVRTVHGNNPYCPSGSRYLKNWGKPCDRTYSLPGCLWGHFIDHCGSIRPKNLQNGFQSFWQDMETLKSIPAIANSEFVRQQMIRAGYNPSSVQKLYYFVPEILDYFPPPKTDIPHFVFAGRITPEKGLHWLLNAIAKVQVPVHLDIAGTGNQEQEKLLISQIQQLKLEDKVTLHGWVDAVKITQLLQQARALIFPSVWHEPAGFVSLEAAAVGRPIIASRVGGIPEHIERLKNGLLVEVNDIHGLAQSIENLAENWNLAQEMGLTGRKMVKENFAMSDHLQKLMQLYNEIGKINLKSE
ncbi:glycosyltransferase family 4 protein [Sphaerospermopsis aphanizomenoides BCCUSP55]|uniref:glycosyltransferase family 4 protein n=1 Tax=Sphaerospermopsis aphanizomenoides TaxID=459663 RepID=UPI001904145F|nr:glycosyltransferase family 4 protein [Sphaerospermopsis aphanizomenoides]MBK1988971.1 glycosyltransferase family 4 protein [Sphaerospermopsis aphanizomenoides BCCUSP55]